MARIAPSPHDVALETLVPESERAEYEARVAALLARNALLAVIETGRKQAGISKKELATLTGQEASSLRRMLTNADTPNPTTDNALRALAAVGVKLEAVLPSGDRISIV